jgi:hypothetical protein
MKLTEIINETGKQKFAESLLLKFEELGLSVLSKADFEAYLFYLVESLATNSEDISSFQWQSILKVTPAKLKSLQVNASVKFKKLDINDRVSWIIAAKKIIKSRWEVEDYAKGTVRLFIDDFHVNRFLENFVNQLGSSPDKTLNGTQFIIKHEIFIDLLSMISDQTGISYEAFYNEILKDESIKLLKEELHPTKQIFDDLKNILKNDSHKLIAQQIIKLSTKTLFELAKDKVFGNK